MRFHFYSLQLRLPSESTTALQGRQSLTGLLSTEDEFYALAKIAGVKMTQAFRRQHGIRMSSIIPPNIYGPEDVFSPEEAHFIPALISRVHQAKENNAPGLRVWGSGQTKCDFIYSEDVAKFSVFFMEKDFPEEIVNIGTGTASRISQVAESIKSIVEYDGYLEYDTSMPEGAPPRTLCCERAEALGWKPETQLEAGLELPMSGFWQTGTDFASTVRCGKNRATGNPDHGAQ